MSERTKERPTQYVWTMVRYLRDQALAQPGMATLGAPLREARAFAYLLQHLPIAIPEGERLAGDFGWAWGDADELARLQGAVDEHLTALAGAPYWDWPRLGELPQLDREIREQARQRAPETERPTRPLAALMNQRFHTFGSYSLAHTTPDYPWVLQEGIGGVLERIRDECSNASETKRAYLDAMTVALEAVVDWAARYAALAEREAAAATDDAERERLLTIAAHCRRVPLEPARTFHEAVQSLWLIHAAVGLSEMCDYSLSFGRMDQYLYHYYRHDLAAGVAVETIEAIWGDLVRKMNRFGDPSAAVNLGGLGPEGEDLYNALSALMVRVIKRLRLPSPIVAARIYPEMDAAMLDELVSPELFSMGQPTFYGEVPCRDTLVRRGVPEDEVHKWAVNSCMGLIMPGEEIADLWGGVANLLLPLELATNRGQPYVHDLPLEMATAAPAEHATFEALLDTFTAYMDEVVTYCVAQNWADAERVARDAPNPYLTALIHDGIEQGEDRALCAARYRTVTIESFGLVNAADALLAIQRLVFDKARYTLDELVAAARRDFCDSEALRQDLRRVPKFGNNDPAADAMAAGLARRFARSVMSHNNEHVQYLPSFHTLNIHIAAGARTAASLDGRNAGEPLAKNMGTMPGRCEHGHTALMLSAAAIDQRDFAGGQALDISVDLHDIEDPADKLKFEALLQTYFRMGGLQVQVNGVSADQLRDAMAHPERHRDLLVRIAGYSARFVTLTQQVQEEMVDRFGAGV
jgi:formate C-acetyltransferase